MKAFWLALCGVGVCASCTKPSVSSPTTPLSAASEQAANGLAPGERPASGRAEEAADAHVPAPDVRGQAFVREVTALRRVASEARFVEGKNKKREANVLTFLQRGEAIEVIEATPSFLRIKLSDESSGWARASAIRVGSTLSAATTLQRLHCFLRPDLLAMEAARTIEPGTILFVLREKDSFSEVDAGPLSTYWVLSDALERDARDVEAAKLFGRARQVASKDAERAKPLFDLLRARFAQTRLVAHLLGDESHAGAPDEALAHDANGTGAPPQAAASAGEANGLTSPAAGEALSPSEMESMQAPLAPPPDAEPATEAP